jgi:hypothetical protein
MNAVEEYGNAVKQHPLAYRPESKTTDMPTNTDLEDHK